MSKIQNILSALQEALQEKESKPEEEIAEPIENVEEKKEVKKPSLPLFMMTRGKYLTTFHMCQGK